MFQLSGVHYIPSEVDQINQLVLSQAGAERCLLGLRVLGV